MRTLATLAIAATAFGGARIARTAAADHAVKERVQPYAPSPGSAPFLALGYRELFADLLFVRLRAYFGGFDNDAGRLASLAEATAVLDPRFLPVYEYGARAMTMAHAGVDQSTYMRAIALLEHGMHEFPRDWRLPYLAGQIYTQDLATTDPAQRRVWDEAGTLLVESAIRMPGAPASAAEWAAVMRTKFGQNDRAVQSLREMLLITDDVHARKAMIDRLAKLEQDNGEELAAEIVELRRRFETAWKRDRPSLPATWYVILGPRLTPSFSPTDLATGGRDLVGSEASPERLEPLE